ncbi:nucleotidyltransferase domain-containing protein [Spirulina sp. CS-785/01]|uniref:type VII toxin-antitoxin system MntA family adenylyltransferase antitoxin n=1 Tax=Spirulina sp. CS-785/01 TaxID=3021716 RepID=UPI00232E1D66|nr:nucleotidyltransferase domain-containing protein [Spirulina sp. CS-785/01]MDB9316005.1 nucleotidyltransferase domain-containing protein [Spirulina sp. CS-785/01]
MINLVSTISQIIHQLPYLKMLILFGSRAKGNTHANSDWDFAVLYDQELYEQTLQNAEGWEFLKIYSVLEDYLQIPGEKIDVVELDRCSPLLAHNIACHGKLLYEQEEGLFEQFKQQSVMTEQELQEQRQTLFNSLESFLQELGV